MNAPTGPIDEPAGRDPHQLRVGDLPTPLSAATMRDGEPISITTVMAISD